MVPGSPPAGAPHTAERAGAQEGSDEVTHEQLRGSSLLLSGRGFATGLKFLAELVIVRYLATEEYGAWTYALSAIVFLRGFVTLGLHRAVTRFVPLHLERGEHEQLAGVVTFVLGGMLLAGSALVASFLLFPDLVGRLAGVSDPRPLELLFILIFLVPVEATDDFLTGICSSLADSRTIFVRRYLLKPILRLALALVLVLLAADVRLLAYGYLLAGVAGVAYYAWSVRAELRRRGLLDRALLRNLTLPVRKVLSYTVPVMGADWCAILLTTTGPLLLGYFSDMRQVALYQVVIPLVMLNRLVAQSFGVLFEPAAARLLGREDHDGLDRLYWRSAAWVAVLSFPAFAVSFTAAEPLTVLLFGARYAHAAPILSFLAIGVFFDATLGFNAPTLRAAGRVESLLGVNVAAALLNLGLNILLIPRMGAWGAAVATGSSWIAYALMKQVTLRLLTEVRGFDRELAGAYGVIALCTFALWLTRARWAGSEWIVGAVTVLATVAVLARARGTLSISETFPEVGRFPAVRKLLG